MDLFEYQARDMFEKHGVPVLAGAVATTPEEARAAAERIGPKSGGVTVVKAQVKTGGRGKAGGVKVAKSADEAEEPPRRSSAWTSRATPWHRDDRPGRPASPRSTTSRSCSTGPTAPTSRCAARRAAWRSSSSPSSAPRPSPASPSTPTSASTRPRPQEIVDAAGFDAETGAKIAPVLEKLWDVYRDEDATLVEVNPLVKTEDGDIVALDGKVTLDANADFRHPDHEALEDKAAADPLEAAAKEKGLNYVKLDGSVGIIGNGAGLVM